MAWTWTYMNPLEMGYGAISVFLWVAGLALAALAIKAYEETDRPAMVHLTAGFALLATAAIATMVAAFLTDFRPARLLLLINGTVSACGYLFVIYSLLAYRQSRVVTVE